ncbi:MAG TPA: Calx-beta domain-containing protein, partial [Thermoanaerobaculia bacterium]|nr:Calx-beta domain-containing protein [Thermoanaerobaculia bacterium]
MAPSPVTLAVASDKPRYKPTETVQLTVGATNASSQPIAGTLRLVLQDSAGAEVGLVGERAVTLPAGSSTQTFSWPAASALPGPYFVVATFLRDGVPLARSQTSLSIIADVSLAAQIVSDRAAYTPGTTVVLTGGVRNTATSTLVAGTTADLSILDPGGPAVFHQTSTLAQLLPGGFLPVAGTWNVGGASPGSYRVELRALNSLGELLALATSSFRIEDTGSSGAGMHGSLTVTPELQGVGGSLAVVYALENRGNAGAPGLVAHLEMLGRATGEPVRTLDVPMPLAAGAGGSGRWRIQTAGLSAGQYLVSLAAVVNGTVTGLAAEGVALLPGVVVDDLELREGDAGSHVANVNVRLLPGYDAPVTVSFATADGSAVAGTDYVATSGTLTFAPGETVQTIPITILGDTEEELHETLLVELAAATGALIADGQAVVTLQDEEGCASTTLLGNGGGEQVGAEGSFAGWQGDGGWDGGFAAPEPFEGSTYFLSPSASPAELRQDVSLLPFAGRIDGGGQAFVFEGFVAASAAAARVVVEYRDEAGAVLDSFDSGAVGGGAGWQPIVDRRVVPPGTRQARVRLIASGAAAAAFDRLALRSIGTVTLFAGDVKLVESAGAARLTLDLSCAATSGAQVGYQTADVEAKAGEDYDTRSGTVTFAAGQLSATLDVPVRQDLLDEEDERFQVALQSDDVIVLTSPATVTVRDDDGAVGITVSPAAVSEGDEGTVDAVFPVTLSAPSGREVRVSYATGAETASAGADFTAASGTVIFPPGVTEREVHVAVKGDRLDELAETFRVVLSSPLNANLATSVATGTIVDDDTASLAVVDTEVVEGDAGNGRVAQVPVNLSIASDRTVTVAYTTVAGTAETPGDFTTTSGTLSFPAGTTQKTISVPIGGESLEEVTETFLVRLSDPQNAELGDPEATVTLLDDDGPVLSIADVSVYEGNAGTRQAVFTVTSARALGDVVWFDDAVPAGAGLAGDGESWTWVSTNPPPFSGSLSHQSALVSGFHQHFFTGASSTLTVNAGDVLLAYVFLDPASTPAEVML